MLETTLGQLLLRQALPPDVYVPDMVLDKDGVEQLFQRIADLHPERYRELAKKVSDIGRDAAYTTGGQSFGLDDLRQTYAGKKMKRELQRELQQVYGDPTLDDDSREAKILETVGKFRKTLSADVLAEAKAANNPLARQLVGAGRGNASSLNSLIGADLTYTDNRGRDISMPVTRSYSQGLTPSQYFAGAYGARAGTLATKSSTQDAGAMAKQLSQAVHRLIVTAQDDDTPFDEGSPRGLPAEIDDPDNVGARLATTAGGYRRNTELTPKILKDLKSQNISHVLVRSPAVGGPEDGGVYAADLGRRERGEYSPIGDFVGLAASQALSEPLTQMQLAAKHSGGVAGAGSKAVSGFKSIDAMVQSPKIYPGGAAHAQRDGRVTNIEAAPQGGNFVTVGGQRHYVGQGYPITVKAGDTVEAGDVLSEGVPSPGEIVKHKGIGAGRAYFVQAFRDTLKNSGVPAHRRNVELLARGLINHVRLTDEVGDYAPDDVVPYQTIERAWQPRVGHYTAGLQAAVGRHLEHPVLHYSVGTVVRPSMVPTLQRHGVKQLTVHNDPPPFEPEYVRGMANVSHDPDVFVKMLGGFQQKSLLEGARRGGSSDESSTSYVPSLIRGVDFGISGKMQGWQPAATGLPLKAPPSIQVADD